MRNILIITFMLVMASCASAVEHQELNAEKVYKRDMLVTVNGKSFEGFATVPKAQKYEIHVEARGDLDMFLMTSCHKEAQKEKAWNVKKKVKSGLFGWGSKKISLKREVKFTYHPNSLESDGDCPMELGGYENRHGRHSWAFIDFESEKYTFPAKINCNGMAIKSNGTSVCQSRNGLIQDITFDEDVLLADNNDCGLTSRRGKKFEFSMPKGKCVLVFGHKNGFHKLTLLGYEALLIRE